MNVSIIKSLFEGYGYDTEIEEFSEVDFRSDKYRGAFVLYLAQEITKAHRGKVVIESEGLGKGATFKVVLPVVG